MLHFSGSRIELQGNTTVDEPSRVFHIKQNFKQNFNPQSRQDYHIPPDPHNINLPYPSRQNVAGFKNKFQEQKLSREKLRKHLKPQQPQRRVDALDTLIDVSLIKNETGQIYLLNKL